ncbi:acyl carrier protein [Shewanella olleyana]|uniref:acyl carrier protein n=1 Tax=Shewanella olleyana TaxID=135626 RepID=UPI00200D04FA|nr:acyl carrier protein [Shewanella olleyana]MCL1066583.1 acyl carrier protein [Shewanella olleyana]
MKNERVGEVVEYITSYIQQHNDDISINDGSNFVKEGLLDSFAILSLIMTLESEFNVKFKPIELANEELQTIKGLAQAVCNKWSS